MIQRVGKENRINFLDIDYDSIEKEIEYNERKREKKSENNAPLKKQSSGNIYKQKSHNMVGFLDEDYVPAPQKEENYIAKNPSVNRPKNKLFQNLGMTSKNIMSSQGGSVSNIGGTSKQIKSETSNSIWEPNKVEKIAKEMIDNGERIRKEKDNLIEARKTLRQSSIDNLYESLKNVDQRKSSSISSLSHYEGGKYKSPRSGMSIFDNTEFERLSNKTDGEILSERIEKERKEKLSNRESRSTKQVTSNDILKNMLDKLWSKDDK